MELRPPEENLIGGGSSSSGVGGGGTVRERDDGSLSSSAPSAFNGFQQFKQKQQEQLRRTTSGGTFLYDQQENENFDLVNKVSSQPDPLTRRLNTFRLQEIGCDVAFVVGEEMEKLKAHKLVLGTSSPVFLAMFYGPLANNTTFNSKVNNENLINNNQKELISSTSCAIISNNLQQNISKKGGGGGTEEEEYEDEEYEEEEYEEEEPDNLSNGSSSITSSLEGEHHLHVDINKPFPNVGIIGHNNTSNIDSEGTNLVHRNVHSAEIPPLKLPQFNRQISHPFENNSVIKRRFSLSKPKNLGHKTVQSQGELQQQLNLEENSMKIELASKGLQMVRVPDCEPKAFSILIDFVYNDFDVNNLSTRNLLNEENVMNTLYAAKKYDIYPLVTECVRYCTARLTANNAVSLLAQARLLDENTLVEQCYQVIDQNTDIALNPNNIAISDIDRDTLINVLGRNQLDPSSELIIFHAAKSWAEAECLRKNIQPTVENLRQNLGPAMQLIRFSLMDVNEFGQAASSSLLTYEEIAEVFLHLTVRPRPPCRFACQGFRANSRSKHVVQRFLSVSTKPRSRREYKVCFTVDRNNILISGLSIYGVFQSNNKVYDENPKTNWEYDVEIKLEAPIDSSSIYGSPLKLLASNIVQLNGKFGDPNPYVAYFSEPILCQADITYLATVHFKNETGVSTFQGKDGQDRVIVELPFDETVTFKFNSYRFGFDGGDGGRTEGQIPAIHFLIQWPDCNPPKSFI
ncbi:BTB domain-containing protein [Meloidogyne graminicola]|uniref:BTB domain-containing protein n=1 Tax=Meloidogyne graminicola TaxID=189291 RepID=A0A8S9ZGC4_9BILA|nr:BTB domain-containing protein [Meloidogyne graminicola]